MDKTTTDADDALRTRISRARQQQARRFGNDSNLNAAMSNRDIAAHARLQPDAKALLDAAGKTLDLSARAYMRTVKVARTIADLADSPTIETIHLTEALQYRRRS